jgi:cytochrome c oxidase assembly protein subunit 15
MNRAITLAEFKKIFFWEFTHRLLGRVIGLAFVIPLAYFALRRGSKRILTPGFQSIPLYSLLAFLIGAQGALGWYMVQSGLEEELLEKPGAVARVSQYRLASHLALALLLYVGMLSSGLKTRMDWKWAHYGVWSGLRVDTARGEAPWKGLLRKGAAVRNFRGASIGLAALVFVTAFSGAPVLL